MIEQMVFIEQKIDITSNAGTLERSHKPHKDGKEVQLIEPPTNRTEQVTQW